MFTKAGLGDVASSWVNSGANSSISNEQLESAVGASTIAGIAEKVPDVIERHDDHDHTTQDVDGFDADGFCGSD